MLAALTDAAALAAPQPQAGASDLNIEAIKECISEGDGLWMTCSGCHESEDGYDVGHYPHSHIFGCKLGGGCSECGGLGAVWDTTDYEDMADHLIAEDQAGASEPVRARLAEYICHRFICASDDCYGCNPGSVALEHADTILRMVATPSPTAAERTECGCTDECLHKPDCVFERDAMSGAKGNENG
jgi:hypothetical protein